MRAAPDLLRAHVPRHGPAPRVVLALLVVVLVAACGSPATPPPSLAALNTAAATASLAPTASVEAPSTWPSPGPTVSPLPSPSASATASPPAGPVTGNAVVTRVVVPDLGIDLPVVRAPNGYPYCNVAMYFGKPMGQPGQTKATYVFAHARDGMFGPIYNLVMVQRTPNRMVGMLVRVYTSDDRLHIYRIRRVYPHQLTLDRPLAATTEQLWLQTSEGPHGTPGKTQVLALPVSVAAADHAAANPKPHIVRCG
jgi:hypothetical protein